MLSYQSTVRGINHRNINQSPERLNQSKLNTRTPWLSPLSTRSPTSRLSLNPQISTSRLRSRTARPLMSASSMMITRRTTSRSQMRKRRRKAAPSPNSRRFRMRSTRSRPSTRPPSRPLRLAKRMNRSTISRSGSICKTRRWMSCP